MKTGSNGPSDIFTIDGAPEKRAENFHKIILNFIKTIKYLNFSTFQTLRH